MQLSYYATFSLCQIIILKLCFNYKIYNKNNIDLICYHNKKKLPFFVYKIYVNVLLKTKLYYKN